MNTIYLLVIVQALLGAFDGIYHHEFTEKLALNQQAKSEMLLHAIRSALYSIVFMSLAGIEWHGLTASILILILIIELLITLSDFVIEDKTRDLPASERITHTLLTLNYGAILALWLPQIISWSHLDSAWVIVNHGGYSIVFALFALGVAIMSIREFSIFLRLKRTSQLDKMPGQESQQPKRYLITGATGFIGQALTRRLLSQRHQVCLLARDYRKVARLFGNSHRLTIISAIDQLALDDEFDIIINLAGEPLAGGIWSRARKMRLLQSRIALTAQIVNFIRHSRKKPEVFISGSAIGYYGSQAETVLDEQAAYDNSFSSQLCRQWEAIANGAQSMGVRTCLLRTGLVLGVSGGMLGALLTPFWYGLGGKFGNGRQWMSWISLDDLIQIIEFLVNDSHLSGAVNATSPNPVTNANFTRALAKTLKRPAIMTLPAFVLKRLLGQAAEELFLSSARVIPDKLLKRGFRFRHPELNATLKAIL